MKLSYKISPILNYLSIRSSRLLWRRTMYLYTFVFNLRHTIIIDIDLSITYLFTSLTVDGLGLRFGENLIVKGMVFLTLTFTVRFSENWFNLTTLFILFINNLKKFLKPAISLPQVRGECFSFTMTHSGKTNQNESRRFSE